MPKGSHNAVTGILVWSPIQACTALNVYYCIIWFYVLALGLVSPKSCRVQTSRFVKTKYISHTREIDKIHTHIYTLHIFGH